MMEKSADISAMDTKNRAARGSFALRTPALALIFAIALGGCGIRARIPDASTELPKDEPLIEASSEQPLAPPLEESLPPAPEDPDPPEEEEPSGPDAAPPAEESREADPVQDENSERKEFSQDASGELSPDAETLIADAVPPKENEPHEGTGQEEAPKEEPPAEAPVATGESGPAAPVAGKEASDKTVTEIVSADEADRLGASEEAPEAETVMQYYQALLAQRTSDLFECKKLDLYWESPEDYTTVHKSSSAHKVIQLAGAYDVSAKLQEDDLVIDDGWLQRKNPGAIVKCVDSSLLGQGIAGSGGASEEASKILGRPGWTETAAAKDGVVMVLSESLLRSPAGQTAAAVYMAKTMYPQAMEDVDPDEAFRELMEESGGSVPSGLYFYAVD